MLPKGGRITQKGAGLSRGGPLYQAERQKLNTLYPQAAGTLCPALLLRSLAESPPPKAEVRALIEGSASGLNPSRLSHSLKMPPSDTPTPLRDSEGLPGWGR